MYALDICADGFVCERVLWSYHILKFKEEQRKSPKRLRAKTTFVIVVPDHLSAKLGLLLLLDIPLGVLLAGVILAHRLHLTIYIMII